MFGQLRDLGLMKMIPLVGGRILYSSPSKKTGRLSPTTTRIIGVHFTTYPLLELGSSMLRCFY